MSILGAIWVTVAVCFIASAVWLLVLADRVPAGEPDQSQLDERDEFTRDRDRERFERMIHPSAGNGLCDLERRLP